MNTIIRLYFDADAQKGSLVSALRLRGVDVETANEAGLRDAPDSEQLAHAAARERVLYTFNVRDFIILHHEYLAEGKNHAGIILAHQQRYSVGEQMRRLLRLVQINSAERLRNTIEFLSAWD
ncbi:MAG: DUF5615 family PIN-like protein [Pyrinomonadaceae bacterium MAG19_C2-C3]|nr:DUF5615 family PIN-like protein [Pyrinomonadaceae bacterium MAG19_C2-C3]